MSAIVLFLLAWMATLVVGAALFVGLDLWISYRREVVRTSQEPRP